MTLGFCSGILVQKTREAWILSFSNVGGVYMKIVILERNSVGTDVSVEAVRAFGEVTIYENTVTVQD